MAASTRGPLGGDGVRVLAALVLGAAVGIGIAASGSAGALAFANGLQPIGALWVNAIRMTVIPLVVSLLITGVANVADLRSMGRLGGRTLAVFLGLLVFSAVLSLVAAVAIFRFFPPDAIGKVALPPGAAEAARDVASRGMGGATSVVQWFTTLVPPNPVEAAATGNMVSLLVFTFLVALATARAEAPTREVLVRFFAAVADVMLRLVRWIIALAPVAIFCLMVPLAAQAGTALVGAVGFYIAAIAIVAGLVTLALYPVMAVLGGQRPGAFARAVLPTQLIGISSSSSVATLPAMVESADALGIPTRVSGFVLPLAVSVFKPAAAVGWLVGALFIARFYGLDLSLQGLLVIATASVFVSFAAPGVPRGAFLLLTPLFTAVGLPAEGIGVLIAVDLLPDMCLTVVNVTGDVAAAALVARYSGAGGEG